MSQALVDRALLATGYNGAQLARALGVQASTISRWRTGGTPRPELLDRLAEIAGVPSPLTTSHPLVRARLKAGLTTIALAELIPTTPSAISHWEAGRRKPSPAMIRRVADVLDVPAGVVAAWFSVDLRDRSRILARGLAVVRARRGWSQRDVARRVGVSAASIQRLENGRRPLERRELERLVRRLGLDDLERRILLQPVPPRPAAQVTRAALLRTNRGLSLSAAAAAARVSNQRLVAMESGQVSFDLAVARRLALAYGVSLSTVAQVFGADLPRGLTAATWPALSVSEALRLLREYSGVRWQDLVASTGRSESTLRRWHAGSRTPRPDDIRKLEIAYGLDVGKLKLLAS